MTTPLHREPVSEYHWLRQFEEDRNADDPFENEDDRECEDTYNNDEIQGDSLGH